MLVPVSIRWPRSIEKSRILANETPFPLRSATMSQIGLIERAVIPSATERSISQPPRIASFIARRAVLWLSAAFVLTNTAAAQAPAQADLRMLHERVVFATVRIESPTGQCLGTGWLLRQQRTRPLIITNRHVLPSARGTYRIKYYAGTDRPPTLGTARVLYRSADIDFAVLWPEAEPPPTARGLELESGDIVRGESVVLGGSSR